MVVSETAHENPLVDVLTRSLMIRLADFPDNAQIRLNINYRSHPSIVTLDSEIF